MPRATLARRFRHNAFSFPARSSRCDCRPPFFAAFAIGLAAGGAGLRFSRPAPVQIIEALPQVPSGAPGNATPQADDWRSVLTALDQGQAGSFVPPPLRFGLDGQLQRDDADELRETGAVLHHARKAAREISFATAAGAPAPGVRVETAYALIAEEAGPAAPRLLAGEEPPPQGGVMLARLTVAADDDALKPAATATDQPVPTPTTEPVAVIDPGAADDLARLATADFIPPETDPLAEAASALNWRNARNGQMEMRDLPRIEAPVAGWYAPCPMAIFIC